MHLFPLKMLVTSFFDSMCIYYGTEVNQSPYIPPNPIIIMLLDSKMSRRDFIKYSLTSGVLFGIGFAGLKFGSSETKETASNSYGNGVYGGGKR